MAIVLRPKGHLDLVGSATLQQKIERVANLASTNQKLWVIDLGEVNLINHFGLTALVNSRRIARQKGCRLFLRNIQPPVQSMLEIAHLNEDFDILPNDANIFSDPAPEPSRQDQNKTYATEVSIEQNDSNKELKNAQSNTIGNLQKILTNIRSKMGEEGQNKTPS